MFRHILVPTDGSALSEKAVKRAVSFGKAVGARLTFFYAEPDESSSMLGEGDLLRSIDPKLLASTIERHVKETLGKAQAIADEAGAAYQTASALSNEPYEAIIAAAEKHDCDLILMASHGFSGIKGLLLGSQTQKVLTHSTIPVLIYR